MYFPIFTSLAVTVFMLLGKVAASPNMERDGQEIEVVRFKEGDYARVIWESHSTSMAIATIYDKHFNSLVKCVGGRSISNRPDMQVVSDCKTYVGFGIEKVELKHAGEYFLHVGGIVWSKVLYIYGKPDAAILVLRGNTAYCDTKLTSLPAKLRSPIKYFWGDCHKPPNISPTSTFTRTHDLALIQSEYIICFGEEEGSPLKAEPSRCERNSFYSTTTGIPSLTTSTHWTADHMEATHGKMTTRIITSNTYYDSAKTSDRLWWIAIPSGLVIGLIVAIPVVLHCLKKRQRSLDVSVELNTEHEPPAMSRISNNAEWKESSYEHMYNEVRPAGQADHYRSLTSLRSDISEGSLVTVIETPCTVVVVQSLVWQWDNGI